MEYQRAVRFSPGADRFDCLVCGCDRFVRIGEIHRYHVMDDGTEIMDY